MTTDPIDENVIINRGHLPRPLAIAPYFLFALAGSFFMFWYPTLGLRELLTEWGFIIWNVFLMLGGVFGIIGSSYRQPRIEIIAVPFLSSALAVYGGSLIPILGNAKSPGALAGLSSIFFAGTFTVLGQGWRLWRKTKISGELDRRIGDGY